jgi:hypothetical protein
MRIVSLCLGVFLAFSVLCGFAQTASSAAPEGSVAAQASQKPTTSPASAVQPQQAESDAGQESSAQKHHIHLRLGTITVGAGYSHWSGPYPYYPYYAYEPYGFYPYFGAYSPWLWEPFWGGYSSLAYPGADKGEVRLAGAPKTAQVFLDGAYAGTADKLKSMWLKPGAYDLSVSTPNRASFHQRIYVLSGKSLKITAALVADNTSSTPEAKP